MNLIKWAISIPLQLIAIVLIIVVYLPLSKLTDLVENTIDSIVEVLDRL